MIYEYLCHNCDEPFELYRVCAERNDPAKCPKCGEIGERIIVSATCLPEVAMVNNELTTDFGDGSGEQTYTRSQYIDKCTKLDREPVGLLWRNKGKAKNETK